MCVIMFYPTCMHVEPFVIQVDASLIVVLCGPSLLQSVGLSSQLLSPSVHCISPAEVILINELNKCSHVTVSRCSLCIFRRWSQLTSCCRTWIRPKTESCGWRRTKPVRSDLWIWTSRSSWAGISCSVFSIKTHSQSPRTLLTTPIQGQCMFRLLRSAVWLE